MKLSVVINTKNAEQTIENTLKSVKFADEIVVVDMKSSDKTIDIVTKYTDKIFAHTDIGYVEPARNFAIKKATGDWILIVDADEEVPHGLRKAIQGIVKTSSTGDLTSDCYYIPRKNLIFNKAMEKTGWWPDYVLRLFKKGYVSWSDEIHSIPITKGDVRELPAVSDIAIIHHNYQHVNQYIDRLNRYTAIQSEELATELEKESVVVDGSFITKKFYSEFLSRFFAQRGVNDGTHGLALSLLQGLSEATVAIKSWEKAGFTESNGEQEEKTVAELSQFNLELTYWIANWHVENSTGFRRLIWKLRRKLYS
jgi:glycosyltransferase involved in cell wall biosynthesis